MTPHTLTPLQRYVLRTLSTKAGDSASRVLASLNTGAAGPKLAASFTDVRDALSDLCRLCLVEASIGIPTLWRLTDAGLRESNLDGEPVNVSPLEASLLLELDKVAIATDAGPVATLQRVVREAADAGDLRTALNEWLYGAGYKPGGLMAKHGDAERVAAYRERFGIAAPVAAKETT